MFYGAQHLTSSQKGHYSEISKRITQDFFPAYIIDHIDDSLFWWTARAPAVRGRSG